MKERIALVWWRIGKYWKTHRAESYREELEYRVAEGIPVSVEQWRRASELLREANDY